ncbi:MAG: gliding motility-associated C-terminal domain-containing protein [Bacteroidales bacterium]|nr:gliding motility-associated C-terminal domain-containing protein [Bacteroidales bacterium]
MLTKHHILNFITAIILMVACCFGGHTAYGQRVWNASMWGSSDSSTHYNYGKYEWPQSPCPEVQIKQKHDHTPLKQYRAEGWDTVVTCDTSSIILSCMPYIPRQWFNGQYTVDRIPYNPPDPTFAEGTKMPVATDDDFAEAATPIPFDFYFFGFKKTAFVLGANGLITFNASSAGKYCPWKFSAQLPWSNSNANAPQGLGCTVNNMRDAIYGIYEDTHPVASYLHGDQGIYYGVQDTSPCYKIICSWNGIPTFPGSRNLDNRCTYQIVCYEGSNIIEVHVKRRGVSVWQNGRGLLGIQNATGSPQVQDITVNPYLYNNAPAAYYPAGFNLLQSAIDSSIAFRFTPQGETQMSSLSGWYRLLDNDTLVKMSLKSVNPNDTNGCYDPRGFDASRPDLSLAYVEPTRVSRYVYRLRFADAAGHWYDLYDTIVVGMDTANNLTLRPRTGGTNEHEMYICAGKDAHLMLEYPELQDTLSTTYTLTRINGGTNTLLPDSLLTIDPMFLHEETLLKRHPIILRGDSTARHVQPGNIDSINVHFSILFRSGCSKEVDFLLRTLPAHDTTIYDTICYGESYTWDVDGHTYHTSTTSPMVSSQTANGCDSTIHLNLKVNDTSYYIDHQYACKPIQWQDSNWYTVSNSAAASVVLKNQWDCDSTVLLDFTLTPMTPIIAASLEYFDFNHTDVVLTDVSTGGSSRTWMVPGREPQTTPTVYYTAPIDLVSAEFLLIESSLYGTCIDTARLIIPFRRDVIWAPNTFTPDIPDGGNDHFHTFSSHLLKEQTLIYNRYGELVFRCEEIDCHWDGNDMSGRPCPQGSYVYIVRYTTEYAPHETKVLKGSVTLLR